MITVLPTLTELFKSLPKVTTPVPVAITTVELAVTASFFKQCEVCFVQTKLLDQIP